MPRARRDFDSRVTAPAGLRAVRIELVRFSKGSGPMSAYALVDEDGESMGVGLFRSPEEARMYANQKAWSVVVEVGA